MKILNTEDWPAELALCFYFVSWKPTLRFQSSEPDLSDKLQQRITVLEVCQTIDADF